MAYRSGRLSIARDRFEVLGVRGDINKSTTFGTEDKCNPLEATIGAALRYQTLRSLTATEIGAGTVNVAKMVRGGSLCRLANQPRADRPDYESVIVSCCYTVVLLALDV